ncbi:MAG: MBL fold metallo-hydrolase [Dehalococcoidia bacterium]|nr:MBL fold metallo-hydrolase [Dehalococcoidia bacterium]MSQ16320.1 MBL fold metallo-hydrolase [Dehalococcoidia bacterium]
MLRILLAVLLLVVILLVLVVLAVALYVSFRYQPATNEADTPIPEPAPDVQGFTIYFIDVGQGDSTLIVDRSGASLLVDAGRSQQRIRDRLRGLGVKDLDAVAMTHPDADHIGGLPEVLELYPIERIYLNGGASDTQTFGELTAGIAAEAATVTTVARGDVIPLGGLQVQVLHPGALSDDSNEDSMVLLVSCGGVSLLLTGDAEAPSERAMLAAGVLRDVDVLKVGHHGSRTSTSPEFLVTVRPEVGVISAGVDNSYGHPHPEVVARLEAAKVQLWATDTTGADNTVTLTSDCRRYQFQPAAGQ